VDLVGVLLLGKRRAVGKIASKLDVCC